MSVKVDQLMSKAPVTSEPHKSIEHVRKKMRHNRIGLVPIVDGDGQPVGVVSASDLIPDRNESSPVKSIMTEKVYTVPQYADVSVAAHLMRKHHIHHVLVTHEQKVTGVLSSFDLLELVEEKRWVAKNAPTTSKRKGNPRAV